MGLRDARAQLTRGHEGFMQAGDDAGGVVFRVEDALDHVWRAEELPKTAPGTSSSARSRLPSKPPAPAEIGERK